LPDISPIFSPSINFLLVEFLLELLRPRSEFFDLDAA